MTHAEQDALVRWSGADAALRAPLLAAVRARFGWPELCVSQDESLQVEAVEGAWVRFTWTFDHDFCSQYDRTESWSGEARLKDGIATLERWERAGEA